MISNLQDTAGSCSHSKINKWCSVSAMSGMFKYDLNDVILPDRGDNIIRTKDPNIAVNPNGLADELFTRMKENQDQIAHIDGETGTKETFKVVLERSIRIACHLKKLGVTSDDIITPCTTNHLNTSPVFYAILFIGAKPASMDPFAPNEDRIKQLDLVKPKYVFAIPETVDAISHMIRELGLNTKIVVFGKTDSHISFDTFLVPLPEEEQNFTPYIAKDLFDMVMVTFSSGTTGSPKGICGTHYSILHFIASGLRAPAVQLSFASMVWASAIIITCNSAALGHIRLLASGFEPKKCWDYLEKYDVSSCFLAPQDLIAMLKHGRPNGLELPHLKMVGLAGGGLSIESIFKAREVFANAQLFIGYGQTEVGLGLAADLITPKGQEEYISKPLMCGKPVKGGTYKVVDPDTEEILGPNQPGELRIKMKTCMLGYYHVDSSDRFDEDGFLKTGDILYYDEEYCFFFVERLKEMLRYKMIAIAPSELEGILIQHPSVNVAVVIGIPTDEGDLAAAVIVRNEDNVTAKELEDLVASKVDDRKKLRGGVYFLKAEEIPFTPSGKIRRRALKEHILSQKYINR